MELQTLKLSEISPSPTNPREDFGKAEMAELSADIAVRGLLQPILVRKTSKGFEIIAGERRYRATEMAGLKTMNALVTEMTDIQAEEAQLAENEKRDNLKPLERAKGYAGFMERHGLNVDDFALKLGKSRSTVYRVVKLNSADTRTRKALAEGIIPSSTAELLAQLPASRQAEATGKVVDGDGNGPFTYRQALDYLKEHYFLDLRQALFDTKDELLYPEAGACSPCLKRSDCQKDIFGSKKEAPLCLDEECWYVKEQAGATAEAARRGLPLLTGSVIFSRWGDINEGQPYLRPETVHPQDAKGRQYKELLTSEQLQQLTVLAITPKHELVELLVTEHLQAAINEAGKFKKRAPKASAGGSKKPAAETEEERTKREAVLATFRKVYPVGVKALLIAVEKQAGSKALLGMLVQKLWGMAEYIIDRRKLSGSPTFLDAKEFKKHFGAFTPGQLVSVLFEIAYDTELASPEEVMEPHFDVKLQEAAKVLGVNLAKVLAVAEVQLAEASTDVAGEVVPLTKAKKPSKPKAKAKKVKPAKKAPKKKAA